ncbi:TadE/TadG family type IV pilus assembly protein [Gemmobacter serpentinus]|uniref:TadE/TadG family type IV pilus assembly protein n=1 Tax=Gemmobacter serpentinus TaxID=2652247 RepID=UPI00124DA836|nr:TadE family protein [Gemmobacter serpentinus]
MIQLRSRLRAGLVRWAREEDGYMAVSFALMLPIYLTLFMMSFEIGMFSVRQTILDRALDITARAVRLGEMPNPNHAAIKQMICDNAPSLTDCNATLNLAIERVSTTTWQMPTSTLECVDRSRPINPVGAVDSNPQARQVLMVLRVCISAHTIFPGTGIGAALMKDGMGDYYMTASSAFLNEP